MRKIACYMMALFLANILTIVAFGQANTISGKVLNRVTNESISAVSVAIKGSQVGTFTDDRGNFKFSFIQKLPVTLVISSVGYSIQEVEVNDITQTMMIQLVPSNSLGQEVEYLHQGFLRILWNRLFQSKE